MRTNTSEWWLNDDNIVQFSNKMVAIAREISSENKSDMGDKSVSDRLLDVSSHLGLYKSRYKKYRNHSKLIYEQLSNRLREIEHYRFNHIVTSTCDKLKVPQRNRVLILHKAKLVGGIKKFRKLSRGNNNRARGNGLKGRLNCNDVLRQFVVQRGSCALCNQDMDIKSISVDHIYPTSIGGDNVNDNIQLAHIKCNSEKGNELI